MDQVDPMDSMDVLCYQKNKSVHLVYKNAVLCRKHAKKPSGFLKQAYGFRDREYNKIKNLSAAGNFKHKRDMSFCHKPSMRQLKYITQHVFFKLKKRFCLRSVDAAWSKVFFCAEYGAGSVFALRGCAVTRCTAKLHACATAV